MNCILVIALPLTSRTARAIQHNSSVAIQHNSSIASEARGEGSAELAVVSLLLVPPILLTKTGAFFQQKLHNQQNQKLQAVIVGPASAA